MRFLCSFVLLLLVCLPSVVVSYELMKDFDARKFMVNKWWVTHRGQRLLPGKLERCLSIGFSQRFKDHRLYLEIDHESSGVMDQVYYPTLARDQGWTFNMDDGETGKVDIIFTDYANYAIGVMKLTKRGVDFLVLYSVQPQPQGELLATMTVKLKEVTGSGIDAVEPVDNSDCPEMIEQ